VSTTFPFALVLLANCLLISVAQAQSAGAELDLGVAAYKQARYEEAITHFKQSITLDPNRAVSHMYMALAFAQQYIPGADTPDNSQMAQQAIDEFEKVLLLNPNPEEERTSLKGIASLLFNMKQFQRAKEYHRKVLVIDPDDAETYYAVGVIDWVESYQPRMEERAKLGLKPGEPFFNRSECWTLRAKTEDMVKEGIEALTKALSLRHDYDDAMAYMNLMYRERADIQCGNKQAYDADIKMADQWVDMTMATKEGKAN